MDLGTRNIGRTAKRRAMVTPVLRSTNPRNDESGLNRHSGRNVSFILTNEAETKEKGWGRSWRGEEKWMMDFG